MKRLYKSSTDIKVSGVCAGVAKYFGVDATLVRLLWVIFAFHGVGFLAYIACACIIPREPKSSPGYARDTRDARDDDYVDMRSNG